MYGKGLLKGLSITLKRFFEKKITEKYPEVKPDLPENVRCFFKFDVDKCTACNLCVNACPNNVITLESERGEDKKKRAVSYTMDLNLCLFCGLCVEACPFDALNNDQHFELACFRREDSVYSFVDENSVRG